MRNFDLFEIALPVAAMKSVTVPGGNGFAVTPEMTAFALFAGLALIVLYAFLR
jgi:hypothetical protein